EQYNGGYDDYIFQKDDIKQFKFSEYQSVKLKPKKSSQKLSYNDQQLLKSLPRNIEDLENEISMAQKLLSDPDFYQNPDAQNLIINLKSMEQELELLYNKWSELDSGQ
ncbi:ABC transporter ATP-binding protein, partial [Candidatus Thioglobus sp.]|nr:ABC transporter ATP-binding protein [Candidatus Thioglobus sp.]